MRHAWAGQGGPGGDQNIESTIKGHGRRNWFNRRLTGDLVTLIMTGPGCVSTRTTRGVGLTTLTRELLAKRPAKGQERDRYERSDKLCKTAPSEWMGVAWMAWMA